MSTTDSTAALEAYGQIMADPNFRASVVADYEFAGGSSRVTAEQVAVAVLPGPVTDWRGARETLLVPPVEVWRSQVLHAYRSTLHIPAMRIELSTDRNGVDTYLAQLSALSGESERDRDRPYRERTIPLDDHANELITLGRTVVEQAIGDHVASQPRPELSKRVFRSKRASEVEADQVSAEEKVRIERETWESERGLDYVVGDDRRRFLKYLAVTCGYTAVEPKKDLYVEGEKFDDDYDEVAPIKFRVHKVGINRTKLSDAVYRSAEVLETARIDLDVPMSRKVLELLGARISINGDRKVPTRHDRLTPKMFNRLKEVFGMLDSGVFAEPSVPLNRMQTALLKRVNRGEVTEQELDEFWGNFISPELRTFDEE